MKSPSSCEINGIRVWRGFISEHLFHRRETFISLLKDIFIPQTAQQMMQCGLQAYFPAIVPKRNGRKEIAIPDEIALVVYPSDGDYERAAKDSVAGRACGALHGTVFNFNKDNPIPSSESSYPVPWQSDWCWHQPYALMLNSIDWREGQTSVLLAEPSNELSTLTFYRLVTELVEAWLGESQVGIDGAIIFISEDYLLYWEHLNIQEDQESSAMDTSLIPKLKTLLETPYICQAARTILVPPVFTIPDNGVDCEVGELLSVTTEDF